jgi:hypothetical protein
MPEPICPNDQVSGYDFNTEFEDLGYRELTNDHLHVGGQLYKNLAIVCAFCSLFTLFVNGLVLVNICKAIK